MSHVFKNVTKFSLRERGKLRKAQQGGEGRAERKRGRQGVCGTVCVREERQIGQIVRRGGFWLPA
jgi:hypothetical protein